MLRVIGTSSKLPNEMLHMISQYVGGNEHCLSLVLSGRLLGFASFYDKERGRHGIIFGPGCYYLKPCSWDAYFTRYICPDSITKFNANHSYWLPGQWLCDNILQLKNLTDLSIKDTKISLPQLARVLEVAHQKITKLDFSYTHEKCSLKALAEHPLSATLVIEAFKRLRHLKITTSVLDAEDYVNDPWVFIVKMLSYCQKCIDLTIDISYDGKFYEYEEEAELSAYAGDVERHFNEEILPRLTWMKSLKSLVLLKHGPFYNSANIWVRSRLLDHLFQWMFGDDPHLPNALTRLWVFCFHIPPGLVGPTILPSLKAYLAPEMIKEPPNCDEFRDVEQIGFVQFGSLTHLPNLKSASGWFEKGDDPQKIFDFIRTHPNLEHWCVYYIYPAFPEDLEEIPFCVPNSKFQLLKLKSLCFTSNVINKEMVEEFVKVYPNLERAHLESMLPLNDISDEKIRVDEEGLAAIRFQYLTSLSLSGFHLYDSSLLMISANCPKLEILHLNVNAIQPNSAFFFNLEAFLGSAEKLREFRLVLDHHHTDIEDVLSVFKSLLSCASRLERLMIGWEAFPDVSLDHPLSDEIIQFAKKMERLVAFCLVFGRLGDGDTASSCSDDDEYDDDLDDDVVDPDNDVVHDVDYDVHDAYDVEDDEHDANDDDEDDEDDGEALIEQINHRMTLEVLPTRPALCFHIGSELPDATDVPLVHYQELVYIKPWNPPLKL